MASMAEDTLTPQGLLRWIVCSLYVDEAVPRATVLLWYWQLLTGARLTQQQLVNLIESTPGISVDPPGSRRLNFRAVLDEPPANFRGFIQDLEEGDPEDIVSPEIWEEIGALLSQGGWPKITDTGVRNVSLAAWLQDQSEKLSEITFGRLLQVVTICTHRGKLLGLRDGVLVPYRESEEHERFANAEARKPTGVKSNESFVETWDDLYNCLRKLINMSPKYEIEISQIKLQCRSKLRKELSETALGHFSLSRLLDDPRIANYIERCGEPTTKPCICLRKTPLNKERKWREAMSKADDSELDDPWADPGKDPWNAAKGKHGKGKESGKGGGKLLAKALSQKSGKGKGSKGSEKGGWEAPQVAKPGVETEKESWFKSGSVPSKEEK